MKLCSIASGSSGNCIYLETEESHILIDAGYSGKQIEKLLKQASIDPKNLDAIFVTHEHSDHIQGVGVLSRRFHIPIYANRKTWEAMSSKIGKITADHRKVFKNKQRFAFKDLEVFPFQLYHDAVDPVGYSFVCRDEKASVLTDTGILDQEIMDAVQGSDIYYFEANHDEGMLLEGPYPQPLKERILSEKGHLSNRQAGTALCDLLRGDDEVVLLAHMSVVNDSAEVCRNTICSTLMEEGIDPERHMKILVAPRLVPSSIYSCKYLERRLHS